ncbi:MAG: NAD(P)H-hydrate dehydratase [Thermoleophilia bacterium]|nr:NAD(P)H-hydrate dehydratase [Thermoleophilia bacterium]
MIPPWGEPLSTAEEMRAAEGAYAGPTLELMERAGAAVAETVRRRHSDARRVSIWCGPGANGGDGLVVGRLLHAAGLAVEIRLLADEARVAGDAAVNLARAKEAGLSFVADPGTAEVVVDALFGTGFAGSPRPEAAAAIEAINATGAPVVAVDVPSGIDASTGRVPGAAVRADVTVTFHHRKLGLAIAPGRFHAGDVEVADIGVERGDTLACRALPSVLDLVPRRTARDNKYSAGSVLVVGGSTGLTGAPCLTAEAALRAGAGIVFAAVPAGLNPVFELRLLEVMSRPCPDEDGHLTPEALEPVLALASRARAVAIGPGLGRTEGARELVRLLLERLELPVVLDADGLFAVAGHLDWVFAREPPTVLTPHAGELGRLLGWGSERVHARRLDAVRAGAAETGAVVLLKGVDTIVSGRGRGEIVSDLGNPGLATAGSGDVLTGILAAFLAKGMEPGLAAAAAATAQGVAAGVAARRHGTAGMIASDVVDALSPALSHGEEQS